MTELNEGLSGPDIVERTESRMKRGVIDAVAAIVGRDIAEELAADIYGRPPPAQQLSAHEMSLLKHAKKQSGFRR